MTTTPVTDSSQLWERLVREGALQPEGHDKELVVDVRKSLGLSAGPLPRALVGVTIERFVRAFFTAGMPFVKMWEDLLAFYERAAATHGSQQLDIVYNFGDAPALEFDLEHFRSQVIIARRVVTPFDLSEAGPDALWNVSRAFKGDRDDYIVQDEELPDPAVRAFIRECREGRYPDRMPPRPMSALTDLDDLIEETWSLGATVLDDLRAVFGSWRALVSMLHWEGTPSTSGIPYTTLRSTGHDHWLPTLVALATTELVNFSRPGTALSNDLETQLARVRNADPNRTSIVQDLEDLLSLPMWRHRYDLYSNWVATQVVVALDDQGTVLHSVGGRLEFSFSGTLLATFGQLSPPVHLWAEFRSPLDHPVGHGRRHSIQPDLLLKRDAIAIDLVPLVIECKQYKRASSRNFGEALTDYARGHLQAEVVLVNYGGGVEQRIRSRVEPDVRDRTSFVPLMVPDSRAATDRFRRIVRESVGLADLVPPRAGAEVGRIELRWGATPKDLDLHVEIQDAVMWQIDYSSRGSDKELPYTLLENDAQDGNGCEVVNVHRWLPGLYLVWVVNFSKTPDMGPNTVRVVLTLGGRTHVFDGPPAGQGQRWDVCTIDGSTGEVRAGSRA